MPLRPPVSDPAFVFELPEADLAADFEASDLTQGEFATERGISFSNLRNWLYQLRKESRPLVETVPTSSGQAPARAPA
jgi:hypothetical protein